MPSNLMRTIICGIARHKPYRRNQRRGALSDDLWVLFVVELARRLNVPGERPPVTISCLHPGVATETNIRKDFPRWMKLMVGLVADPCSVTPGCASCGRFEIATG